MKEKIGMRKLMKYVEEMQKEGINICRPQFQEYYLVDMMLISRYYGLIKWLVENDKIDISKANDKNLNGYEIELRIRAVKELVADSEEKTVLYLNLLMLLSISNSPIDDLISYLK